MRISESSVTQKVPFWDALQQAEKFAAGKHAGTYRPGLFPESGELYRGVLVYNIQRMLVDGASDRRQHVFFGYSQFAADDNKFRIENVYQSCYRPSERMADLFDAFNGKYIFFVQCGQNVVQGYFLSAFILSRKYGCFVLFIPVD